MLAQTLSDITLFVADVDVSAAFYRAIGCEVLEYEHAGHPRHYDVVLKDVVIQLFPASTSCCPSRIQIGIRVGQLDDASRGLDDIGAEWTSPGPKRLSAKDPEGNIVHITQLV